MRRPPLRTLFAWFAALIIMLPAAALAQEFDARATALLDGLTTSASGTAPTTLDTRYTMTMFIEGQSITTETRSVVDFVNERAVIFTSMSGMETKIKIADGKATMSMMGMELPAPDELIAEFGSVFDEQPGTSLTDGAVSITFDGPVSYGEFLSGDQVTIVGEVGMVGAPEASEMHMVFGASGALLGTHMPTDDGEVLMVYEDPLTDMLSPYTASMYLKESGEWQFMSVMRLVSIEFDVTIDESLF